MTEQIPPALHRWTRLRMQQLQTQLAGLEVAAEQDSLSEATGQMMQQLSEVEATARRTLHALTYYAVRNRILTQTEVARRSGITVTAAGSRASSRLAFDAYDEAMATPVQAQP